MNWLIDLEIRFAEGNIEIHALKNGHYNLTFWDMAAPGARQPPMTLVVTKPFVDALAAGTVYLLKQMEPKK
jgi:hypothetical protein